MNLAPHLPALQVVVPLIAAPLTVLLRRRSVAFAVALAPTAWIVPTVSVLSLIFLAVLGALGVAHQLRVRLPPDR